MFHENEFERLQFMATFHEKSWWRTDLFVRIDDKETLSNEESLSRLSELVRMVARASSEIGSLPKSKDTRKFPLDTPKITSE